jgi:hypothetical protein
VHVCAGYGINEWLRGLIADETIVLKLYGHQLPESSFQYINVNNERGETSHGSARPMFQLERELMIHCGNYPLRGFSKITACHQGPRQHDRSGYDYAVYIVRVLRTAKLRESGALTCSCVRN